MDERDGRGLPDGLTADIAALAVVMTENGLHTMEVEANGVRVHLTSGTVVPIGAIPHGGTPASAAGSGGEATPVADDAPTTYDFRSPMIGTFYTAPGPTEEPFVRVGDHVTVGKTVALIEAMKINNEIQSDRNGTVEEIYVSNGQPVEFNQRLLRLSLV